MDYGTNLTFIITPNTGYCVLDVLIDSTSAGAVISYPFVNVTGDHTITASFTSPVKRISGLNVTYYSTLQQAYDEAALEGDVIQALAVELTGDLAVDGSKTVTIEGGYDCGFASVIGKTSLKGNLLITGGKVTAKNISVKQ